MCSTEVKEKKIKIKYFTSSDRKNPRLKICISLDLILKIK